MSLTEKYQKVKNIIAEYYWVAFIPFLLWTVFLTMKEKEAIDRNKTITYGMVYGSTPLYKKYSKRNYNYQFYYKGKKYTNASTAFNSKNVQKGNFYKVEFSDKNPDYSQMIFDVEYVQQLKTDTNGKIIDTIFITKDQRFRDKFQKEIENYKFELDTIKD